MSPAASTRRPLLDRTEENSRTNHVPLRSSLMRTMVVAGQVLVANLATTKTEDEALEAAVRDHARLVYRVAYSILRNHHDAEDAAQETFVKVLKYRRRLGGVQDQRTWLARIAWRVALDRKKKTPD